MSFAGGGSGGLAEVGICGSRLAHRDGTQRASRPRQEHGRQQSLLNALSRQHRDVLRVFVETSASRNGWFFVAFSLGGEEWIEPLNEKTAVVMDQSLLGSPRARSMLEICGERQDASTAVAQEQQDVSPAVTPSRSLMDELLAEGTAAREAKLEKKRASAQAMKSEFGSGMKAGLARAFASKRREKRPATVRPTGRQENVAEKMVKEARAASGAEWVTPELLEAMQQRPAVWKVFADPRYASALEAFRRDPKAAAAAFEASPDLRDFLREWCELMGTHFDRLGDRAVGPLAQEVLSRADHASPATPEEQAEVDRVVNDPDLAALLMDPDTQRLMQRCADPSEFARAARDPNQRAIIARLEAAGLVKVQH